MREQTTVTRQAVRVLGTLFVCAGLAAAPSMADELRDPTKPWRDASPPQAQSAPGFVVNAIFVSDTRQVAVVNGRRVGVGDRVDGAEVVSIVDDAVTVRIQGRRVLVPLRNRRKTR